MKPINLSVPASWDELSETQLQRIAILFNTAKPSAEFDLKVFYILLNIKWWQFVQKARIRMALRVFPMSDIRNSFTFIYEKNDRTIFPPFLKIGKLKTGTGKLFFAPQNRIANLTADEFSVADDLHIKWRETKNIEYLQYLAAVLYTRTKTRPDFDKNQLHDNALLFKKIPVKQLLAMEIAYFGCKNNLVKRFPKVFPKPVPGAAPPKKKYGFGKVILSMAKGDLSKVEKIKKVNIYTFLEQFEEDLTPPKK